MGQPEGARGANKKKTVRSSDSLKHVAAIVTGLAALAGTVFGAYKAFKGDDPATPVKEGSTAATPSAAVGSSTPARIVKLLWGPSDCGSDRPRVGLGGCADFRELAWLEGQVERLRSLGVQGFRELPRGVRLEAKPSGPNANWLLFVRVGADAHWTLGVGYDALSNAKDGALRLFRSGNPQALSPAVFLDSADEWIVDGRIVGKSP